MRTTDVMTGGKSELVCGYDDVGKETTTCEGTELEAFAEDETLPDPENTTNPEFKCIRQMMTRGGREGSASSRQARPRT